MMGTKNLLIKFKYSNNFVYCYINEQSIISNLNLSLKISEINDFNFQLSIYNIVEEMTLYLNRIVRIAYIDNIVKEDVDENLYKRQCSLKIKNLYGNSVLFLADDSLLLDKLLTQIDIKQNLVKITKMHLFDFNKQIELFKQHYQLCLDSNIFINNNSRNVYLKIIIEFNNTNHIIYISKNFIYYFSKIIFGIDVEFLYNEMYTNAVIDSLFNYFNKFIENSAILVSYMYARVNNKKNFYKFKLSNDIFTGIFLIETNNSLVSRMFNKKMIQAENIFDNKNLFNFSVLLKNDFKLTLPEINSLSKGDVLILSPKTQAQKYCLNIANKQFPCAIIANQLVLEK